MTVAGRNPLRVWIVACTVGELLGFGVAGTLAALVFGAVFFTKRSEKVRRQQILLGCWRFGADRVHR